MERISMKRLKNRLDIINESIGANTEPYSKNDEGRMKANIGTLFIAEQFNGKQLQMMITEGGGITVPVTYDNLTSREMDYLLNGIQYGLRLAREGK